MNLVNFKTNCELLGVDFRQKITKDDIRKAYKKKVLIMHPDKESGSNEDFQKLNEAYNNMLKEFDLTSYFNSDTSNILKKNKNLLNKNIFNIMTSDAEFISFMYSNPIKQPVIKPLEINLFVKISDIINQVKKTVIIKRMRINQPENMCYTLDLKSEKYVFPEGGDTYLFRNGEFAGTLVINIIPSNQNNFIVKNKYDIHHDIILNHKDWLYKKEFNIDYFGKNIKIGLRKPLSKLTENCFRVVKCPTKGLFNRGNLYIIFYKTC